MKRMIPDKRLYWSQNFQNFYLSVPYYKIKKLPLSLTDTVNGIKYIGDWKLKCLTTLTNGKCYKGTLTHYHISNSPSYDSLCKEKMKNLPRIYNSIGAGLTDCGLRMTSLDLMRIYFISGLYYGDLYFTDKVVLQEKITEKNSNKNNTLSGDSNLRSIERIKKARRSLRKWLRVMNKKGLKNLRENNISPLHFSNLKWE